MWGYSPDSGGSEQVPRFALFLQTQYNGPMAKRSNVKVAKTDPVCIDGVRPRPMFVDYKDLDLLSKLTNRHGRIVSRRKTGCQAASQHAVSKAIKRARFMALMSYEGS